jgi:hypothetical protein
VLISLCTAHTEITYSSVTGGKGGEERARKVNDEGAAKIFDTIENVVLEGGKGRRT